MNLTDTFRTRVVLLHSNDIHSRLEHAAKIASFIAEERRTYGSDLVLAVDCGDHMDRMRVETEGSDGIVNVELLNDAGYEVITLGNNEGLTYSFQTIAEAYVNRANFAVVCANMHDSATGEQPEWMLPSTIIDKNGLRIGIIGVTAAFSEFYSLLGWQVTDPFEAVQAQAAQLRDYVDVLVVMSHLGLSSDRLMAEKLEGIDLILGAHTHHLLEEPIVIGSTTICAAGKFGEYIGRVEIGIDPISARPVFRAVCVPYGRYGGASRGCRHHRQLSRGGTAAFEPDHRPARCAAARQSRAGIAARQPAGRWPAPLDRCGDRHRQHGSAARRPRAGRRDSRRIARPLSVADQSVPDDHFRQRYKDSAGASAAARIHSQAD